ncbi:tryptophan synthase beta subunit-like PLP-dependent enzyme [Xylogone sp. PMI_703]|nr:tryptophan synthase beta subunit-like PLP-dependent enzyme [Xylogone sp. PMI_703]
MASTLRRPLYLKNTANLPAFVPSDAPGAANQFHRSLPGYSVTKLVSLTQVADEIGVKAVYLKEESERYGLPSFKILGASWGTIKAIVHKYNLPADADIPAIKAALAQNPTTLYTATDGNHGRAVARMGSILGVPVEVFIPAVTDALTAQKIKDEGANVTQVNGSYDDAVKLAWEASRELPGGLLVQDTGFSGYELIPQWIIEGYSTMLREVDEQLGDQIPDLVIAPVGVGSFAQAVVTHYKSSARHSKVKVMTVEPDTAACLYKSLTEGERVVLRTTTPTIMAGMDCGTASESAWPYLQSGVDASGTVSDYESHEACKTLSSLGVSAGPCGAAPLAALRRLSSTDKAALNLNESSVVVLFCTEGQREYSIPRSVAYDDAETLLRNLVQINSAVPGGGSVRGPGETEIARYISSWLEHRDIETHWLEPTPGRPSIIGVVKGTGGGKTLMINGHIDTVTVASYEGDPLSGHIENGRLHGRGSADMKGGLAASLVTLAQAKIDRLQGDLIFTGVADEEDLSIGTEQVLEAGWRADAAIVCEPTCERLVVAHKGFVWFEVIVNGVASHGSRFDLGVDAISRAGYFLVELDKYAQRLINGPKRPPLGTGSVHASIIKGGEEPSSYPASCSIIIERRTIAGETLDQLKAEMEDLLKKAAQNVPDLSYELKVTFSRSAFEIASDHPYVSLVADQIKSVSEIDAVLSTEAAWTDCALISDSGIPVVMYGPIGEGLHAKEEWVDLKSVDTVTKTVLGITRKFCGQGA